MPKSNKQIMIYKKTEIGLGSFSIRTQKKIKLNRKGQERHLLLSHITHI